MYPLAADEVPGRNRLVLWPMQRSAEYSGTHDPVGQHLHTHSTLRKALINFLSNRERRLAVFPLFIRGSFLTEGRGINKSLKPRVSVKDKRVSVTAAHAALTWTRARFGYDVCASFTG